MTVTHDVEREDVMAYLDGELAPARAAAVAVHLDGCAECRALATEVSRCVEWSRGVEC